MNERRLDKRYLVNLNVRLYNDELGHIDGRIHDVSSGGMYIDLPNTSHLTKKLSNMTLFVRPGNMDILFNMECIRVNNKSVSLRFID